MDFYTGRGTQSCKEAVSQNIPRKAVLPVLTIFNDPVDQELARYKSS